eukprot:852151-Pyramimonas_sp.AAC.1
MDQFSDRAPASGILRLSRAHTLARRESLRILSRRLAREACGAPARSAASNSTRSVQSAATASSSWSSSCRRANASGLMSEQPAGSYLGGV